MASVLAKALKKFLKENEASTVEECCKEYNNIIHILSSMTDDDILKDSQLISKRVTDSFAYNICLSVKEIRKNDRDLSDELIESAERSQSLFADDEIRIIDAQFVRVIENFLYPISTWDVEEFKKRFSKLYPNDSFRIALMKKGLGIK